MKKFQRKMIALVAGLTVLGNLFAAPVSAAAVGDVIGYSQPTDIVATINGYQLESYNVNDYTYICVEDLVDYGFDVHFDAKDRTLSFARNAAVTRIDPQGANPDYASIGTREEKHNILFTDIVTYANGEVIDGSNINGKTIINFDELGRFGVVSYDDNRREISLYMDDVEYNAMANFAEYLQKQDTEYNPDWKVIYRAKGDIFVIVGTSRRYATNEEFNLENLLDQDRQEARAMLETMRSVDIPVSAVRLEYRNADNALLYSFEVN